MSDEHTIKDGIFDLQYSFEYAEDAGTGKALTCRALKFRRPKGREANAVFTMISSLSSINTDGGFPDDLADTVLGFVDQFAKPVGNEKYDMAMASQHLDAADIMNLAGAIVENFT